MKFKYSVPVVAQDLPPTEALNQTFDHLKHLEEIMNDCFFRISTRIKDERTRINSVKDRVAVAQHKVKSISENQNRVTTVYSSAKYLAPKILPDFQRVCNGYEPSLTPNSISEPYKSRASYRIAQAQRRQDSAPVDITDLFTYLSQARANRGESEAEARELDNGQEGLGRLPAHLPSISSVLLFNSEENPYKKYVSINNLEGVGGKDKEEVQSEIPAAPQTIIRGDALPAFTVLDYEYRPNLGEVPRLALPDNLPLNFLAEIRFDVATNQKGVASIAPSISTGGSSSTLALPAPSTAAALPALEWNPTTNVKQPNLSSALPTLTTSAPIPTATSIPVPPTMDVPVPPTPSFSSSSSAGVPVPPPIPDAPADIPIPPPLPDVLIPTPPPVEEKSSAPSGGGDSDAAGDDDNGGGGGDSLMDAIRKASKKGLRKVADQVIQDNKVKKEQAPASSSNDIMSQLKMRLQARHNVISGKLDRDERRQAAKEADEADAEKSKPTFRLPGSRQPVAKKPVARPANDEDEPAGKDTHMADVVIKAFVDKHKAKHADDEGGDSWGT